MLLSERPAVGSSDWLGGRGSSFEPDLNFVAIRIGDVSVGEAGSKLAATKQAASGAFDLRDARSMSSGFTSRKPKCATPPLRPAVVGSSAKVRIDRKSVV